MLANLLTLSRLGFLIAGIWLLYAPGIAAKAMAFVLVWVVILIDAVDGAIARRRGEASALGSVLDIAIDRVVENVYWITFTDLQLVPVWIALIVVTRGILTDAVRGFALARGTTPFEMMQTNWGRLLVSHRFMRAVSGTTKVVTFAGLVAYVGLLELWQQTANARFLPPIYTVLLVFAIVTALVNVLRGLPVLLEARRFFAQPDLIRGRY